MESEKRVNIYKVIAIVVSTVVITSAACYAVYCFFKKYFRISFDCGNCTDCSEDCFDVDFDPELDSEDYEPECSFDSEEKAENADEADA